MRNITNSITICTDPKHTRCHQNRNISCGECRLNELCLPIALEAPEIDQLDHIVKQRRPLKKGEFLYKQGTEFSSIFAVRAGSFKTFITGKNGCEQVTGLFFPGEIIGMDGIGNNEYLNSAMALDTTSVCEIPFSQLEELGQQIPSLSGRFVRLLGKEISKDQQMLTILNGNTAEERVAALLLSISTRHYRRKLSATQFHLPMTRADIGSYLGITLETVSRVFSKLQKENLIVIHGREIEITDLEGLRETANLII